MAQKKTTTAKTATATKERTKTAEPAANIKPPEVKPPVTPKVKAEPKALSPIEKWNILKLELIAKFPVLQPGELDITNCTIDDMKAHVEMRLSKTKDQIRQIVPGY